MTLNRPATDSIFVVIVPDNDLLGVYDSLPDAVEAIAKYQYSKPWLDYNLITQINRGPDGRWINDNPVYFDGRGVYDDASYTRYVRKLMIERNRPFTKEELADA